MRAAGAPKKRWFATTISAAIILAGLGAGAYALHWRAEYPATDDGTIDADVVHVAAAVGGRISHIPITENAEVAKGDLLFQIDPQPFQSAVDQAEADLATARAGVGTQTRAVLTQRSAAVIASAQVRSATTNLDLAQRTVERLRPLAAKGYVPAQQFDQAETLERDAVTALQKAREQQSASAHAIDTIEGSRALVQARLAALAIAKRALADTTVRASHAGRVVGLTVSSGEIVAPSQSLFTLVNSEEWFAVANFREFDLGRIKVGDCATVYSMIDRRHAIKGVVQGIGSGVLDDERINLPKAVPYVEKSLNWVRVAQRFPVRVRLERPPADLMRLGASAVVEVRHGLSCR